MSHSATEASTARHTGQTHHVLTFETDFGHCVFRNFFPLQSYIQLPQAPVWQARVDSVVRAEPYTSTE